MINNKGVTLVELLIVIAIIAILAAVAVPTYIGQQKRTARQEAFTNLETMRLLQEQFYAGNSDYAPIAGGPVTYDASPPSSTCFAAGGIEDEIPGFRPGGCQCCGSPFGLNFVYSVIQNKQITGVSPLATGDLTPCFVATATGAGDRIAATEVYAIDCNNVRNF